MYMNTFLNFDSCWHFQHYIPYSAPLFETVRVTLFHKTGFRQLNLAQISKKIKCGEDLNLSELHF